MVEVLGEVRRNPFPFLVWNVSHNGCESSVKRWRGNSGAQHSYRAGILLDNNFVATAHTIQQCCKIACRVRSRDVDDPVSHFLIIH